MKDESKNFLSKLIKETVNAVLASDKKEDEKEIELSRATLQDGETILEYENLDAGTMVYVVTEVEGEEKKSPAPEGEHILETGKKVVVDSEGKIIEVIDGSEGEEEDAYMMASLQDTLDLAQEGEVFLSATIKDGKVTEWSTVQMPNIEEVEAEMSSQVEKATNEAKELKSAKEALESEKEQLEAKLAAISEKGERHNVQDTPEESKPLTKKEMIKSRIRNK